MQYQTDTVTLVQKIVLFDPFYFENSNIDQVISIKASERWLVGFGVSRTLIQGRFQGKFLSREAN